MIRSNVYKRFWWRTLRKRDHIVDPGQDGRLISIWIFRKWDGGHELDWSGLEYGQEVSTFNVAMNLRDT